MSTLVIFKSTFVNGLRSSIRPNLNKYLRDAPWVAEVSTKTSREMQTPVEPAETLHLELPQDGDLKDLENAIRMHRALRTLSPLQARDPRLWTRLAHVDFWQYMRLRWQVEKHMADQDEAVRFIDTRYFVSQSQSRALLRNGIARLWWVAHLSCDPERENPYELTTVLLSTLDITQQILERGLGRAPNIIRGFLEFLLRNSATLLSGGNANRKRIRRLAKFLNMHGGVCILDCLSQGEIMDLLAKEMSRIMTSEAVASTENTST